VSAPGRQFAHGRLLAASRILFYWTIKTIAWPVTRVWVRLGVSGGGNVPRRGACIVVANHTSYVDAVVLGSACPRRLRFLITAPIYRMLRLRWFYYMMGSIPLAAEGPDPGALKTALRTLGSGGAVGIFPEGQRMPDGELGSGKAGVAVLAARTGAPVVPAAIIGAHHVMPVGGVFPRPRRIRVVFGTPMVFPAPTQRRASREQIDAFAEAVMEEIRRLLGTGAPRKSEDWGSVNSMGT